MADKAPGAPRGHVVSVGWPSFRYSPDGKESAIFHKAADVPEGWHDGSGGKGAAVPAPSPSELTAELLTAAKELDERAQALDDREAALLARERELAKREDAVKTREDNFLANPRLRTEALPPAIAQAARAIEKASEAAKAPKVLKMPAKQPFGAANLDAE